MYKSDYVQRVKKTKRVIILPTSMSSPKEKSLAERIGSILEGPWVCNATYKFHVSQLPEINLQGSPTFLGPMYILT